MHVDGIIKRLSRINYEQEIIKQKMDQQVLAAISGEHQMLSIMPSIVNNNDPIVEMLKGGRVHMQPRSFGKKHYSISLNTTD